MPRSPNTRLNLVLFRLACCCGLRASEIASLQIDDVRVGIARPHLRIRHGAAKGSRANRSALVGCRNAGRYRRLARRTPSGACRPMPRSSTPGVPAENPANFPATRSENGSAPRARFLVPNGFALTIHHGRHTFVSHALAGGRTLAEVRDAAGHANVSITSEYLHVAAEDAGSLGRLFE